MDILRLLKNKFTLAKERLASCSCTKKATLAKLAKSPDLGLQERVAENNNTDCDTLQVL